MTAAKFFVKFKKSLIKPVVFLSAFLIMPAVSLAGFTPSTGPHAGITHSQYPNGLTYPSFNNYTDNNSTTFPDERAFLKAKIVGSTGYQDNIAISPGQTVRFVSYIHNDADYAFNQSGQAKAVGTAVKQNLFSLSGTDYISDSILGATNLAQTISASNTVPGSISDTVTLSSASGLPVRLRYVANTLGLYLAVNHSINTALNPAEFFGGGQKIGNNGTPNTSGVYYGCEPYRTFLYFDAVVEPAPGTLQVSSNLPQGSFYIYDSAWSVVGSGPSPGMDGANVHSYNLNPGDYTIAYGNVDGYKTPANQTATVVSGQTAIRTGVYKNYDLAVSIHADDDNVAPNTPPVRTDLTYDVTAAVAGAADSSSVFLVVDYDETKIDVLNAPGAVNNGNTLTYSFGGLSSGASITTTIEVRLKDGVGSGAPVAFNTIANVSGTETELDTTNNTDIQTVTVDPANADQAHKRVTNLETGITGTAVKAMEGHRLEYVLSYRAGNTAVAGHVFKDDITDILQYASVTDARGGAVAGSIISWPAVDIQPFQEAQVSFIATIYNNISGIGGDYRLENTYGNDVTVVSLPNLALDKKVSVNGDTPDYNKQALPGDHLIYTLSVANTGPGDKLGFIFEDNISDILEYSAFTNVNGGSVNKNANDEWILSWLPVNILAGQTVTKTFEVNIMNPLAVGGDYAIRNIYGTAVTTVALPNIIISKTVSNSVNGETGTNITADAGHTLTYILTAENTGAANQTSFVFQDNVSDILEYADIGVISDGGTLAGDVITWPAASITAGQSLARTFNITVKVFASWPNGTAYDRKMTNIYGNQVDVTLPGTQPQIDIEINKTADKTYADQGDIVAYTLSYANTGNIPSTNTVITDDYDERYVEVVTTGGGTNDGDKLTWNRGTLAVNSTGSIVYTMKLLAAVPRDTDIVNTAIITANEVDPDLSDNQDSTTVQGEAVPVTIVKSVNPAEIGNGQVQYQIAVENKTTSMQTVTVTDNIATGLTYTNGGQVAYTAGSQNVTGPVVMAAGSVGDPGGVTLTDISPLQTVFITYLADVSRNTVPANQNSFAENTGTLTYTIAGASFNFTDASSLTIDGAQTGNITVNQVGKTGVWTLSGPQNYTGSGSSWTKTNAPAGSYIITPGNIAGYNAAVAPSATQSLSAGGSVSYTITYTQIQGTLNVTVADQGAGALYSGSTTVDFTVVPADSSVSGQKTVSSGSASYTTIIGSYTAVITPPANYAVVGSSTRTITVADGGVSSMDFVIVSTLPSLTLSKTDSPDPVTAGSDITYTLEYGNTGPGNAVNANIVDAIPANTAFIVGSIPSGVAVSYSNDGGTAYTYSPAGSAGDTDANITHIKFLLGTINAGVSGQVRTYKVRTNTGLANGTTISNTAAVSADTGTPVSDTELTQIHQSPNINIVNTASSSAIATGGNITYTYTYSNAAGASDTAGSYVWTQIPANTVYVSAAAPNGETLYYTDQAVMPAFVSGSGGAGWSAVPPANTTYIVWDIGAIPAGTSLPITHTVTASTPLVQGTVISNIVNLVAFEGSNQFTANDLKTVTVLAPNFTNTTNNNKTSNPVSGSAVNAGDTITYSINYQNDGDLDATGVAVTDDVDETYLENIQVLTGGGVYDGNIIAWNIGNAAHGAGGQVSFSAKVKSGIPSGINITNTAVINSAETAPFTTNAVAHASGFGNLTVRILNGVGGSVYTGADAVINIGSNSPDYNNVADNYTIPAAGANTWNNVPAGNYTARITTLPPNYYIISSPAAGSLPAGGNLTLDLVIGYIDLKIDIRADDTTVPPNPPSPGAPVSIGYIVEIENIGTFAGNNAVVEVDYDQTKFDVLNAPGAQDNGDKLVFGSGAVFTVNPGEKEFFNFDGILLNSAVSSDSFDAAAVISMAGNGIDMFPANNTDTETVSVNSIYADSRHKRVTNLNDGITGTVISALEGDRLEYTLSYTAGDTDAANTVIADDISDVLRYADLTDQGGSIIAGGTLTWPAVNIPAYQTHNVHFTVQIKNAADWNTAGDANPYQLNNGYGNDITVVALPNLTRNKTVSVNGGSEAQNASALPGDVLGYKLKVSNTGAGDRNAFVFSDDVTDILEYSALGASYYDGDPVNGEVSVNASGEKILSWSPVVIPAGQQIIKTFTAQVSNTLIAGGDYTLRNAYGNDVTVVTLPDISISKSAANLTTGQNGVAVNADENQSLRYTLKAQNIGAADYPSFVFTDNISDILEYSAVGSVSDGGSLAGGVVTWPAVNIAAGGTATRTFDVTINPLAAWPNGSGYDRVLTNVYGNTVTADLPGTMPAPDLKITKLVNGSATVSANSGSVLTYTIAFTNEGNIPVNGVRIEDDYAENYLTNIVFVDLAGGNQNTAGGKIIFDSFPAISVGETRTVTYTANIAASVGNNTNIINSAEIFSSEVDSDLSDNQSSTLVIANPIGNVTVSKSVNPVSIANGTVTYTISVSNYNTSAVDVAVTDTVSAGLNPANGGTAVFSAGSQNIVFEAGAGGITGTSSGSINTGSGVVLTGIPAHRTARITYQVAATNAGVPLNGASIVENTASIAYSIAGNSYTSTGASTLTITNAAPNTGTIQVNTNLANASFSVVGQSTGSNYAGSGISWTQTGALADTYTITFASSGSGYIAPAPQTQTLVPNSTIIFTGTYTAVPAATGTIQVNTNLANASFSVVGQSTGSNYAGSGISWTQTGALADIYTIVYGDVAGYEKPQPHTATLAAGGTITFSGTYTIIPSPPPPSSPQGPDVHWGGGRREVEGKITLTMLKEVSRDGKKYIEASAKNRALKIALRGEETLYYRITVKNTGPLAAKNVKIKDEFENQPDKWVIKNIYDVSGAVYDKQSKIFTISSIDANNKTIITYKADVSSNNIKATIKNKATILSFTTAVYPKSLDKTAKTGLGSVYLAYISSGAKGSLDPRKMVYDVSLEEYVDPGQTAPQDKAVYHIKIKNTGTKPLSGIMLYADYDENRLEPIQHILGKEINGAIRWKIARLWPEEEKKYSYTVKIKKGAVLGQIVHHSSKVFVNEFNAEEKRSRSDLRIAAVPPAGSRLPQSGENLALIGLVAGLIGGLAGIKKKKMMSLAIGCKNSVRH